MYDKCFNLRQVRNKQKQASRKAEQKRNQLDKCCYLAQLLRLVLAVDVLSTTVLRNILFWAFCFASAFYHAPKKKRFILFFVSFFFLDLCC